MSTTIDFDEKLKKRTIDFCNDELNWHLSNAEPDEYADETLAELELLFKLGDEWNAKKYAREFIENMKSQIAYIEDDQPGLTKWIESMRSKVKEAENLIQECDLKEKDSEQSCNSCNGCSNCSHAPGNAEEFAMANQDPTTFYPDAYTEKAQYCGNNNKNRYTDLRTLSDGTHFEVVNGGWTGYVFERDGEKYMHIDYTGRDVKLTGKEDLIIDIINVS